MAFSPAFIPQFPTQTIVAQLQRGRACETCSWSLWKKKSVYQKWSRDLWSSKTVHESKNSSYLTIARWSPIEGQRKTLCGRRKKRFGLRYPQSVGIAHQPSIPAYCFILHVTSHIDLLRSQSSAVAPVPWATALSNFLPLKLCRDMWTSS